MRPTAIQAPVALLLDPALTPAAKLLWLLLSAAQTQTCPPARMGLSHTTIRRVQARLREYTTNETGPSVPIPTDLLTAPGLRPQAKLLYGLLQTLPHNNFTYPTLGVHAHLSPATAKQHTQDLARTGWLHLDQKTRLTPIQFTLLNPDETAAKQAQERIDTALNKGEAIMRLLLSLLIDDNRFKDNYRPDWLTNPQSGVPLEIDRYYLKGIGFEFDGPQHNITTDRFPSEAELADQRTRDLIKEGLCARHGVTLIRITGADLTLAAMQQKIGGLLPLRQLTGHQNLIRTLEKAARKYRASMQERRA